MTDPDVQNWIEQQVRLQRERQQLDSERRYAAGMALMEARRQRSAERQRLSAERRRRRASSRISMRQRQLIQQGLEAPTSGEPYYGDQLPRPLIVAQSVYGPSPRPGRGWYKSPESSTEDYLVTPEQRAAMAEVRRLNAERRLAERHRLSAERRRRAALDVEMRQRQLIRRGLGAPTSREPYYVDEHPPPALTAAQQVYGLSPRPGRGWYKSPESSR
jgi:hypothetical protein